MMTYTVHEMLVDKLFQEYQREPPMDYSQVTLAQLTVADRRAWKLMSEEIQGDLGRNQLGGKSRLQVQRLTLSGDNQRGGVWLPGGTPLSRASGQKVGPQ